MAVALLWIRSMPWCVFDGVLIISASITILIASFLLDRHLSL